MSRDARALAGGAAVIVAALIVLGVGPAALVALGIAVGAVAERRRLGVPLPGPRALAARVRRAVGWPAALGAGAALAAAALLLLTSRGPSPPAHSGRVSGRPGHRPVRLVIRTERPDRAFAVAGVSYRVHRERRARWALDILGRPAGRGRRWVTIAVIARDRDRRGFDPARLPFRLRDGGRTSYVGTFRGATGPRSLSTAGALRRGQAARVQLGFKVPRAARRLTLVFEDPQGTAAQLQVPLGRA